jgi:HAD superfamily hydrolase (TIGR01509 family)
VRAGWGRSARVSDVLALIDLDGTLVDRDRGFALWARALVAKRDLGDGALIWLEQTDREMKERDKFFTLLSERFPAAGSASALWNDYSAQMPGLAPAFPGVLAALARLRERGWRLGVVTNGRVDNQIGKLRRAGIWALLDGWCVSEEVGIRKPDPAIFALARQRCGASRDVRCWVVGDDPSLDIAGGSASGMGTIWVSHGRPWSAIEYRPDRIGSTPAQALALLDAD